MGLARHLGLPDPLRRDLPPPGPEERAFAPTAEAHRRGRRMTMAFALSAIALASLGAVAQTQGGSGGALLGLSFGLMLVALFLWTRLPLLRCSYCRRDMDTLGDYCPSCGERSVEFVDPDRSPVRRCASCQRTLRTWKGGDRSFTIHFCGRCGGLVDRLGF